MNERSHCARIFAFGTQEGALAFQALQFNGKGEVHPVEALGPLELASGDQVSIVRLPESDLVPVLVGPKGDALENAASSRFGKNRVDSVLWEPVAAANKEGLTHYHVSVRNDPSPRVVPTCTSGVNCRTDYALSDGRGYVVAVDRAPVYHVAASSPEEALELVAPYCSVVPATSDVSKRVMEVLQENRAKLSARAAECSTSHLNLSLDVDGADWFVSYDKSAFAFTRVYQREFDRYCEALSPLLPMPVDVNAYSEAS